VAERVFAKKLTNAGFVDVEFFGHSGYGIDEISLYPLFTPDLIEVMRRTFPPQLQRHLAVGVIIRARKAATAPG
jgi:hypothetical protein